MRNFGRFFPLFFHDDDDDENRNAFAHFSYFNKLNKRNEKHPLCREIGYYGEGIGCLILLTLGGGGGAAEAIFEIEL